MGNGATARTRTAGLLITNQLLYQLSYGGNAWMGLVSWAFRGVKPLFEIWKNWPKLAFVSANSGHNPDTKYQQKKDRHP